MSIQNLERQKKRIHKKTTLRSNEANLELIVDNEHTKKTCKFFSINNRRYLGNKYKLNDFIKKIIKLLLNY